MYVLVFHVPVTHAQQVKDAVFAAGAGKMSNYEQCCWQVLGTGQFFPSKGSRPFLGNEGKLEMVPEYRIETTVQQSDAKRVVEALICAHPYEVPSYHLVPVLTLEHQVPT